MIFPFTSCLATNDDKQLTVRWRRTKKSDIHFGDEIFTSPLNVSKLGFIWLRAISERGNSFSFAIAQNWRNFPIEISFTTTSKSYFHSFPHRFRCNWRGKLQKYVNTLIRKNFHYIFPLSLALSLLYIMNFPSIFSPAVAGVFFVSCLVKAPARSALNFLRWKNIIFRNFSHSRASLFFP